MQTSCCGTGTIGVWPHMEADALYKLGVMRSMQLLIRFLAWSVCHAT